MTNPVLRGRRVYKAGGGDAGLLSLLVLYSLLAEIRRRYRLELEIVSGWVLDLISCDET